MAVFDMAQHVVSGAAGVIGGSAQGDVAAARASMQERRSEKRYKSRARSYLSWETSLVNLCMKNHVRTDNRYPLRAYDRNLPLLFGIAYPVCNYD